jgi:hypothetical protein
MVKFSSFWPLSGLLVLALMSACSQMAPIGRAPVYDTSPPPPRQSSAPGAIQTPAPSDSPSEGTPGIAPVKESGLPTRDAVTNLVRQAWDYYDNKDPDKAIVVAERAQRLDARSPEVYLILASSYHYLGHENRAIQFARRGLNFSFAEPLVDEKLKQLLIELSP